MGRGQTGGIEQREEHRVGATGTATLLYGAAEPIFRVVNLSPGGVGLAGPRPLTKGIRRDLLLRTGGLYLEVPARVAWSRRTGPGRYRIGLAFDPLSPDEGALLRGAVQTTRPGGAPAALVVNASVDRRDEFLRCLGDLGLDEQEIAEAATPLEAIALLLDYPEIRLVFGDPELSRALAEEFPAVRWVGGERTAGAPAAV